MNFIQQAYKGRNDWPHYFGVILLVFIGWQLIGVIPITVVAAMHSPSQTELMKAMSKGFVGLGIDKNLLLFLMILTFVFGLWFLIIGIKRIHKRSVTSLITSRKKIDWKRFFTGFLTWGFIGIIVLSMSVILSPNDFVWNFKPAPFFTLLAVSLLFLPLQTSFEELLFRGYLMQGFGTWFRNRWLPLILTSVIFGLLHSLNPEVEKLGYISMVFYIGTGFFYGIITLMDEGTELALGLHAVNNIVAAVFITTDWTVFQTDALYVDTSEPSVGFEMFFPVLVLYPLMLYFFSKKYNWTNWQEKLLGKIEKPQKIE